MGVIERTQHRIDHIRCPAIKGLPTETVDMLHHSIVDIVRLRRSIERAQLQVSRSWDAAIDSMMLLGKLRQEGF